jgi:hypothetical protein
MGDMAAITVSPRLYQRRHVLVPADLDELRGPTTGTVTLPIWVYWSGDRPRQWRLDNPADRRELYRTVVREAKRPGDLDVLDGETLKKLWPELLRRGLPPPVRGAWEDRHPDLAAAGLPAAS